MLFNSNIFLFAFLPVVFAGFIVSSRTGRPVAAQVWLALCSLVFYAWSGIALLPLLLASIAANFLFGRLLARGWRLLPAGIAFNLLLLGAFKYGGFLGANLAALTGWPLQVPALVLPLGISFYTFTQIAFLVDVRRGTAREYDLPRYALFVTFFPHLIAGPIIHHREIMPQFGAIAAGRKTLLQNLAVGLVLLSIGLAKKCLIADPLGSFASPIFARAVTGQYIHFFIAWSAALAFTFQIYFDFSGYSDIAIGLARMFGIRFPANFNSPYQARSIIAFWRRWHMTLSRFLREYLYIPLGGNRHGTVRRYANLMLTMLIGGLWHGAAWTFVLWGGLHGGYLLVNHAFAHGVRAGRIGAGLQRLVSRLSWPLTFVCVVIAWVMFRAAGFTAALHMYGAMFGLDGFSLPLELKPLAMRLSPGLAHTVRFFAENDRTAFYTGLVMTAAAAAIAFFLPNALQCTARARPATDFADLARLPAAAWRRGDRLRIGRFGAAAALISALFAFLAVRAINAAAPAEFLYFQF